MSIESLAASLALAEAKIAELTTKVQKLEKEREVLAIDEVEKSMIIDTLSEIEALGKADAEKIENLSTVNKALEKENGKLKYRINIILRELDAAEKLAEKA